MRQLIGQKFIDFEEVKKYNIPDEVIISTAATGIFVQRAQNPKQAITPTEMIAEYEDCIGLGAVGVHVHARDPATGRGTWDPKIYHAIVDPLKSKYGEKILVDGGTMSGKTFEQAMTPVTEGLFEVAIVNPSTGMLGNYIRAMHPLTMQAQAKYFMECGVKPQIDVHDASSLDNAKRFLIDKGLIEKPTFWHLLPGLPGTFYIPNEMALCETLLWFVRRIREIDRDAIMMVSDTSRNTIYMPILAMLLGLHIRVGMEDTIWRYPHKDELLQSNKEVVQACVEVAAHLGRKPATASSYRKTIGLA